MQPQPKPEPRAVGKRRQQRAAMKRYYRARAEVFERENGRCQRCKFVVSDELPEWHSQRAHVHHMDGRRGDRLYDVSTLELLCRDCHMPSGRHARRV